MAKESQLVEESVEEEDLHLFDHHEIAVVEAADEDAEIVRWALAASAEGEHRQQRQQQ